MSNPAAAPKMAVLSTRYDEWVRAITEAEPRLDVRGWHSRDALNADARWLADAEALFAWNPPPGFLELMPRLRWLQNGGAGVDHLLAHPEIPPSVMITRADGQFGLWMARYVVAHLLASALRIDEARAAQAEVKWDASLYPEDLTGTHAVVVGFGRIGRQIGRALRELGMVVHGVVRTPRADAEFPLHGASELPSLATSARLLVLSAPLTSETGEIVNWRVLERGNGALLVVNVGRGGTLSVPDLLAALDAGTVRGAVLDVFSTEPLPADSPLWRHPKVIVTPHHSGPSTPAAMIPDMLDNLRRYAEGRPPADVIDRKRGY